MTNYERTAARRMLGKAYEKAGLADLDNKSWVLEKQQAFFTRLTPDNQTRWKQLAYENPDLAKQAYAEISSSDFNTINKIVQYMWSNMSTKEFDDMLSQVAQPKGGSENLTNVASPGQPPAKVSAVGDSKTQGYGREAEVLGNPTGGWTDSRGRRSNAGDYLGYDVAPGAFVSGQGSKTVQTVDGPQQPYGKFQSSTDNPHQV